MDLDKDIITNKTTKNNISLEFPSHAAHSIRIIPNNPIKKDTRDSFCLSIWKYSYQAKIESRITASEYNIFP